MSSYPLFQVCCPVHSCALYTPYIWSDLTERHLFVSMPEDELTGDQHVLQDIIWYTLWSMCWGKTMQHPILARALKTHSRASLHDTLLLLCTMLWPCYDL